MSKNRRVTKRGFPSDEELLNEIHELREKRDQYRHKRQEKEAKTRRETGERIRLEMSKRECNVRLLLKKKETAYYARQLRKKLVDKQK